MKNMEGLSFKKSSGGGDPLYIPLGGFNNTSLITRTFCDFHSPRWHSLRRQGVPFIIWQHFGFSYVLHGIHSKGAGAAPTRGEAVVTPVGTLY